jgi:hypothetical protein
MRTSVILDLPVYHTQACISHETSALQPMHRCRRRSLMFIALQPQRYGSHAGLRI